MSHIFLLLFDHVSSHRKHGAAEPYTSDEFKKSQNKRDVFMIHTRTDCSPVAVLLELKGVLNQKQLDLVICLGRRFTSHPRGFISSFSHLTRLGLVQLSGVETQVFNLREGLSQG